MKSSTQILLVDIIVDERTQHRTSNSSGHIENIRDGLQDGKITPNIRVVSATDTDTKKYYLVDGFHRVEAHFRAKKESI